MNVNRATDNPGGMECEDCGVIFVGSLTHALCNLCHAKMLLARPENADLAERIDDFIANEYSPPSGEVKHD
jgi:hypothetical protein